MTIHYSRSGREITAWIEHNGLRISEGFSDRSLEEAIGRLVTDLAQRDDPNARPRIALVEVVAA